MAKIKKIIGFDIFSQFFDGFGVGTGTKQCLETGTFGKCQCLVAIGAGADPKTIEKLRKNIKTNYFF